MVSQTKQPFQPASYARHHLTTIYPGRQAGSQATSSLPRATAERVYACLARDGVAYARPTLPVVSLLLLLLLLVATGSSVVMSSMTASLGRRVTRR